MNAETPASPDDSSAQVVETTKARGESAMHLHLKRAALCWALHQGYYGAALEVNLPNSSYRADVAAYRPQRKRVPEVDSKTGVTRQAMRDVLGSTAIFECKQSRADFLKDSREVQRIREELAKLALRRETLELQLKVHYPRLQRGDSLFPEYQSADLEHLEHAPYRRVVRRMENLQRQLYGQTKFDKILRQGIANLYYLVVPPNLVSPAEIPTGWGLLEAPVDAGGGPGEDAVLRAQPVWQESWEHQRLGLLQRIMRAAMRSTTVECGYVHPASRERAKLSDVEP